VEVIPKMFLQPNFSLHNAETFNSVFPWNQIEALRNNQPHQSSKLLQEKVDYWLIYTGLGLEVYRYNKISQ